MSKSQRIIAAVLVFAALGYLIAYTIVTHPHFTSGSSDNSTRSATPATGAGPSVDHASVSSAAQTKVAAQTQPHSDSTAAANSISDPINEGELSGRLSGPDLN